MRKTISRTCLNCSRLFEATLSNIKLGFGKCCSKSCAAQFRMTKTPEQVVDLFNSKFTKGGTDDCWEWTGQRTAAGYGILSFNGKSVKASRFAYQLAHGKPLPSRKILACHKCDNPPCVNPNHIFAGTHADNNRDREMKGRGVRPPRKLTPAQIQEIRESDLSQRKLAKQFNVAKGVIQRIKTI